MEWLPFVIAAGIGATICVVITLCFVRAFIVEEGNVGLFYRNGRLVGLLQPGANIRAGLSLKVVPVDTRSQESVVQGQEVLTADNVSVKISLTTEQRVSDPIKAARTARWWPERVYTALQIALRNAVATRTLDEVLRDRGAIGKEVCAQVADEVAAVGVEIKRVAVRDVMLSADLRRAFAEAVRLREEGKAALEKARAETAALRSLANAARVLKDNPDLLRVRVLQSIETVGTAGGNTLVLGTPLELSRLGGTHDGQRPDDGRVAR